MFNINYKMNKVILSFLFLASIILVFIPSFSKFYNDNVNK